MRLASAVSYASGRPYYLSAGLETEAAMYFFNVHVPCTPFAYIRLFQSVVQDNDLVQHAMLACALADSACFTSQTIAINLGRTHYCKALATLRDALDRPDKARDNGTLLCLLLLSAFEARTLSTHEHATNWANHVHGLTAVMCLRSEEQFEDELGQKLFCHASLHVLTNCFQRRVPAPEHLMRLLAYAKGVLGMRNLGIVLGSLLGNAATLRSSMRDRPPLEVVSASQVLDKQALEILTMLEPQSLQTTAPPATKPNDALGRDSTTSETDVANSFRQCNVVRILRICFREWIFAAVERGADDTINERSSLEHALYDFWQQLRADAILDFQKLADEVLLSVANSLEVQAPRSYLAIRSILSVLIMVADSDLCQDAMKASILRLLTEMGTTDTTGEVNKVLSMLDQGHSLGSW